MTKIEQKLLQLEKNNKTALVSYIVAGDPDIETSYEIISKLIESGSDIIELGMPFSDPVADGKTIQQSHKVALKNEVNLKKIFKLTMLVHKKYPDIPIILMGYLNPIHKYGISNFVTDAKKNNISGLIIVDLPYEEALHYPELNDTDLPIINLITSLTNEDRFNKIDQISSGFLYYISVFGITGTTEPQLNIVKKQLQKLKNRTTHKIAVGFGIKSTEQVSELKKHADLIVIGSAYCKIIQENSNKTILLNQIENFNKMISASLF